MQDTPPPLKAVLELFRQTSTLAANPPQVPVELAGLQQPGHRMLPRPRHMSLRTLHQRSQSLDDSGRGHNVAQAQRGADGLGEGAHQHDAFGCYRKQRRMVLARVNELVVVLVFDNQRAVSSGQLNQFASTIWRQAHAHRILMRRRHVDQRRGRRAIEGGTHDQPLVIYRHVPKRRALALQQLRDAWVAGVFDSANIAAHHQRLDDQVQRRRRALRDENMFGAQPQAAQPRQGARNRFS